MELEKRDGLIYVKSPFQPPPSNRTEPEVVCVRVFVVYQCGVQGCDFSRVGYHFVICATGFKFDDSIFSGISVLWLSTVFMHPCLGSLNVPLTPNGKHPLLTDEYESAGPGAEGLYFAGTLTHGLDYRKATGGFIHGFRYSARALAQILLVSLFFTHHTCS